MVQIAKVLEWHLYYNGVSHGHFKQANNAFSARTTPVTMTTHQRWRQLWFEDAENNNNQIIKMWLTLKRILCPRLKTKWSLHSIILCRHVSNFSPWGLRAESFALWVTHGEAEVTVLGWSWLFLAAAAATRQLIAILSSCRTQLCTGWTCLLNADTAGDQPTCTSLAEWDRNTIHQIKNTNNSCMEALLKGFFHVRVSPSAHWSSLSSLSTVPAGPLTLV